MLHKLIQLDVRANLYSIIIRKYTKCRIEIGGLQINLFIYILYQNYKKTQ